MRWHAAVAVVLAAVALVANAADLLLLDCEAPGPRGGVALGPSGLWRAFEGAFWDIPV